MNNKIANIGMYFAVVYIAYASNAISSVFILVFARIRTEYDKPLDQGDQQDDKTLR